MGDDKSSLEKFCGAFIIRSTEYIFRRESPQDLFGEMIEWIPLEIVKYVIVNRENYPLYTREKMSSMYSFGFYAAVHEASAVFEKLGNPQLSEAFSELTDSFEKESCFFNLTDSSEKDGSSSNLTDSSEKDTIQANIKDNAPMSVERKADTPVITDSIGRWLDDTPFPVFREAISQKVIGQDGLEIVLAAVYNYLKCIVKGIRHQANTILAAPSGCGKTETFRALRDYFKCNIPGLTIYQYDMTGLTTEGFKGRDTESILTPLLARYTDNGIGIVFLDEFDKKVKPCFESGGSNVNMDIQSQILTLIEGTVFEISDNRKYKGVTLDTSNTMFIASGSFADLRRNREEQSAARNAGFGSEWSDEDTYYAAITKEDIIKSGSSYELLGRFTHLVNYLPLKEDAVKKVIRLLTDEVGEALGCPVMIGSGMEKVLLETANGRFGCRALRSLIYETAFRGYIEMLNRPVNPSSDVAILVNAPGEVRCICIKETVNGEMTDLKEENDERSMDTVN